MGRDVWLFYVDDSTNDQHDLLAAVAVPVGEWNVNLGGWLDHRKMLAEQHGLPSGYEFHASKFLGVRGNPHEDVHQPINWDKALRRTIYEQCLDAIVALPSVEVLAVHQRGRQQRLVLYRSLLDHLSVWLEERDALGIVVMDGEDVSYRGVHRQLRLADRRIIEDACSKAHEKANLCRLPTWWFMPHSSTSRERTTARSCGTGSLTDSDRSSRDKQNASAGAKALSKARPDAARTSDPTLREQS